MRYIVDGPRVTLIAKTVLDERAAAAALPSWTRGDGDDAGEVAELAGRICYDSFQRPNAATASNANYLDHIIEVGHTSTLEHNSYTFVFSNVSRSFSHEDVRHRHGSPSQRSQRYCDEFNADFVIPTEVMRLPDAERDIALARIRAAVGESRRAYRELVELMVSTGVGRKAARGAARCVLGSGTATEMVKTGNARYWREYIEKRLSPHADSEIRDVARMVLVLLNAESPNLFGDLYVKLILGPGSF